MIYCKSTDEKKGNKMENGITNSRLVINRFMADSFSEFNYFDDLDEVIDAVGIRIISVIPEDINLSRAAAEGRLCLPGLPGTLAFDRLAARLEGEDIPIIL